MKKVMLKWNKANVWSVGTGMPDGSVFQLVPGLNEKDAKLWDEVKKHPEVKSRMGLKVHCPKKNEMVSMLEEVVSSKAKPETGSNDEGQTALASLNQNKAKDLVKETFNTELLREWLADESRAGVSKAIEAQLEGIEKEREGEDDENTDDNAE